MLELSLSEPIYFLIKVDGQLKTRASIAFINNQLSVRDKHTYDLADKYRAPIHNDITIKITDDISIDCVYIKKTNKLIMYMSDDVTALRESLLHKQQRNDLI